MFAGLGGNIFVYLVVEMKKCKCGVTIDFVLMESGKRMPVEIAQPVKVVVKTGAAMPGSDVYKLTSGLIPHWINCAYSKKFKKGN